MLKFILITIFIILIILIFYYINTIQYHYTKFESFGIDDKPFEPDNTLYHRNPWDDINYIKPTFLV